MFVQYENRDFPYSASLVPDLTFLLHLHRQAELIYVLEGCIEMAVDAHARTLFAGEPGMAFPHCGHSYRTPAHSRVIMVIFDAALAGDCAGPLLSQRPDCPFLAASDVHEDVRYLVPQLVRPMEPRLLKGMLQVVCARLFPLMRLEARSGAEAGDWTRRALTYLNEHFTESVSLDELAAYAGVSRYHLSRSFPAKVGCGLNAYLHQLRADHAAQLLSSTAVSITQAGYDSGFDSTSTFFRVFKQRYGLSPGAYRAQRRAAPSGTGN